MQQNKYGLYKYEIDKLQPTSRQGVKKKKRERLKGIRKGSIIARVTVMSGGSRGGGGGGGGGDEGCDGMEGGRI